MSGPINPFVNKLRHTLHIMPHISGNNFYIIKHLQGLVAMKQNVAFVFSPMYLSKFSLQSCFAYVGENLPSLKFVRVDGSTKKT